jgi:hypothetical protein
MVRDSDLARPLHIPPSSQDFAPGSRKYKEKKRIQEKQTKKTNALK